MTSYADLFLYPGQPAGEDRLLEIECAIGKRLPDDYRTLIRETGGGTLKLAKCVMPGLPGAAEDLATEDIFEQQARAVVELADAEHLAVEVQALERVFDHGRHDKPHRARRETAWLQMS